ncbi:MAG: MBL fold metallo-hydrolase [bacterium]|nr:MBL fold metallo-hydrolase [bacterium]
MTEIHKLIVGSMASNCYIFSERDEAIIIDPGDEAELILDKLNELKTKPVYIVNTHGHLDHISANDEIKMATGAKILIHKNDAPMLTDAFLNLSATFEQPIVCQKADKLLEDGEVIKTSNLTLKVLHTPGHTQGGICLVGDGFVFTGDTLFQSGIGRTDFPCGSYKTLINSITNRLLTLPDEFIIYPGHGDISTIGMERQSNPFLVNF